MHIDIQFALGSIANESLAFPLCLIPYVAFIFVCQVAFGSLAGSLLQHFRGSDNMFFQFYKN